MLCLWMTSGASINIEAIPRFVAWAGETKPDQGPYAWSGFSHPWEGEAGGGRSPARFALVVEGNPGLLAVLAPEAGQPEALLLRVVVAYSFVPRGPVRPHARSCIQREGRKSRPQRTVDRKERSVGAVDFLVFQKAETAREAYRAARDEAVNWAGEDPYNGTISTTDFVGVGSGEKVGVRASRSDRLLSGASLRAVRRFVRHSCAVYP